MVRNLEGEKLDGWLDEAEACVAPAMGHFAAGLRKDLPAVRAGLTEPSGATGRWRGSSTSSSCSRGRATGGRVSTC